MPNATVRANAFAMPKPTTIRFADDATVRAGYLARQARLIAIALEGLDACESEDFDSVKSSMNGLVAELEAFATSLAVRP